MRSLALSLVVLSTLVACRDKEFACADVIEQGEGFSDSMDGFIGIDACYYSFADDKGCEDEGGTAHQTGDYGWDKTCA